jgi:pteridine reductase
LHGKCALVTGAGRRLGKTIASALGDAGASLALHYHTSREGADEVARDVRARGAEAYPLQADLDDRAACRKLVEDAESSLGRLDLLVVSAANFERVELEHIDDDTWDRALRLNLTAAFALAHAAAPALARTQGSIVFITCSSATTPFRNYLPYVVSKGALRHLMKVLALELAPTVRVNAVAPGTVLPPDEMAPPDVERLVARLPLARRGAPEDVAEAVLYLASAGFVTGQEILVDGGRNLARVERF